jgi:hypothetical protein
MLERMQRAVPEMLPKAHRWVGEMAEIAKTFKACGLTPLTFEGAAEIYAAIADTSLGRTSPEDWRESAGRFEDVITTLARDRAAD